MSVNKPFTASGIDMVHYRGKHDAYVFAKEALGVLGRSMHDPEGDRGCKRRQ